MPELYGSKDGPSIVECCCGMRGPEGANDEEAQELWDELPRAPTPEGEALREVWGVMCNTLDGLGDDYYRAMVDFRQACEAHGIQLPAEEGENESG